MWFLTLHPPCLYFFHSSTKTQFLLTFFLSLWSLFNSSAPPTYSVSLSFPFLSWVSSADRFRMSERIRLCSGLIPTLSCYFSLTSPTATFNSVGVCGWKVTLSHRLKHNFHLHVLFMCRDTAACATILTYIGVYNYISNFVHYILNPKITEWTE